MTSSRSSSVSRAANGHDGFRTLIVGEESIDADFSRAAEEDLVRGEMFGLALALLVLVVVFGGVAAAVVPIGVAIASIVVALAVVAGIGQAFVLNFIVVNVLVMMGLAVGIDYSLFVVSRFREERRAGLAVGDAVAVAGATANRAVLFSGATVVLALVGMFLVPHTIFRSIAVGAIAVVLVSVLAALTLLPAALAVLGDRIERLRVPLLGRRAGAGLWSRVAAVALRRPGRSLAAGVAVLVALALPYAGIETGSRRRRDAARVLPDACRVRRDRGRLRAAGDRERRGRRARRADAGAARGGRRAAGHAGAATPATARRASTSRGRA